MKRCTLTLGCLLGDQAAACLMRLLSGEKGSRNYTFSSGSEYGYYYEPRCRRWIVFDNRHSTCLMELCNTDKEAEAFLYDDSTDLFAA